MVEMILIVVSQYKSGVVGFRPYYPDYGANIIDVRHSWYPLAAYTSPSGRFEHPSLLMGCHSLVVLVPSPLLSDQVEPAVLRALASSQSFSPEIVSGWSVTVRSVPLAVALRVMGASP